MFLVINDIKYNRSIFERLRRREADFFEGGSAKI